MSFIAWNCRGLGSPEAVDSLHDLVKQKTPALIFLTETKALTHEMMRVKRRLHFKNGVAVDPQGRAGGLAMLWDDTVDITLRSMSKNHIDVLVNQEAHEQWRLIGVYGWPERSNKFKTWELLRSLHEQMDVPWMIMGDFNEVLYETEKNSRNPCDFDSVQQFRSVVDELLLKDVACSGYSYT